MICEECIFAYTDVDDDEDIYSCPFSFKYAYHSNEKCHYPKSYNKLLRILRPKLNLYKDIKEAIIEELDTN